MDVVSDPYKSFDPPDDTIHHGEMVSAQLSNLSNEVKYNFYCVAREGSNGYVRDRHLISAIGKAHEHSVDIINISLGNDHLAKDKWDCTENGQPCSVCRVTKQAIDDGVIIVPGAGNALNLDSVCCPALCEEVVAVGGFVAECRAKPDTSNKPHQLGKSVKPPGAYWVENPDGGDYHHDTGVYCSTRGCAMGISCEDNQYCKLWDGNVPFTQEKPDTLAPVQYIANPDVGPIILSGTSFATPIVTAGIVNIVSYFESRGIDVTSEQIRNSIRETNKELDDGSQGKFSCVSVFNNIGSSHGIHYTREEHTTRFEEV